MNEAEWEKAKKKEENTKTLRETKRKRKNFLLSKISFCEGESLQKKIVTCYMDVKVVLENAW